MSKISLNDALARARWEARAKGQHLNLAGWCSTGHHRVCQRKEKSNETLRKTPCECPCHGAAASQGEE